MTQEGDPGLRVPGDSLLWITIAHFGFRVASVLSTGHDGTEQ
jgi:hypothetical protein